jgi:hypothetical protein
MPNVVRFFNDVAPRIGELQRHYEESRPKVVSISIVNHSEDVDPGRTEIIVKFDRPMREVTDSQAVRDPRYTRARFDDTATVLSFGVVLDPDQRYRFPVAWPGGGHLVSSEGVPMIDYVIQFHTRPSGSPSMRQ